MSQIHKNIAILISGNGSNLQSIIDQVTAGKITANICLVLSNVEDAFGLQRAQQAGIATEVLVSKHSGLSREEYDAQLAKVLAKYDVEVKGPLFDTMIAHYLINPDMRHNMDILAETYLGYKPQPITELIGKKGPNQGSMRNVPIDKQTEYAVEDADITLQLKNHFVSELASEEVVDLFTNIELPLVNVLAAMESAGIHIDVDYLDKLAVQFREETAVLEDRIYEQAGERFNLASPKQLGPILFDKLKLVDKPKKTKTGQYSTAEDVLSYLAKDHQIIQNILDYRGLSKLKSTYVDALPLQVEETTGRIHTDYMQTVAATGRLSSNNPNLQNIPIRTERGRQVRKAFIPRNENYTLLAADYSQIELRIMAHLSQDEGLLKAFSQGLDVHSATAAEVFDVELEEVTPENRRHAKAVNFGLIYGMSRFGLAKQLNISNDEAAHYIDTYFARYPDVGTYMESTKEKAKELGYVETLFGRRLYLPQINASNGMLRQAAERTAINAPMQGSAADIIKIAMIEINNWLRQEKPDCCVVMQVHDELVFEVAEEKVEEYQKKIVEIMTNSVELSIPLIVDVGVGDNWEQAH